MLNVAAYFLLQLKLDNRVTDKIINYQTLTWQYGHTCSFELVSCTLSIRQKRPQKLAVSRVYMYQK